MVRGSILVGIVVRAFRRKRYRDHRADRNVVLLVCVLTKIGTPDGRKVVYGILMGIFRNGDETDVGVVRYRGRLLTVSRGIGGIQVQLVNVILMLIPIYRGARKTEARVAV